jgi:nucleotide-binding universal stress UspA family protein
MKIVVGYVVADEGEAALQWAVDQAARGETEIIVVHSIRGGGSPEAEQEQVLTYRPRLDEIEQRLTGAGIPHTVRRLIRGLSPAEDLISVAKEHQADLIAIGIRRRSRTGKLLMGSNAQEVLLNAECPVVAVKGSYVQGRA